MKTITVITEKKPVKRIKIILWIAFALLIIAPLFMLYLGTSEIIAIVILSLGLIDFIVLYLMADKYYNWSLVFFVIFFIGLLCKRMHWPLAGFIATMGVAFICVISLTNSVRFQVTLRQNTFLRWFGSIAGIIIALYLTGWLFMLQSWPKEIGDVFAYIGAVLFIISVMGMVFTLPGSNYIGWKEVERKIFFRAVLIPMLVVFFLIVITLVVNDAYRRILGFDTPPWVS